jgi:hypothetical protein
MNTKTELEDAYVTINKLLKVIEDQRKEIRKTRIVTRLCKEIAWLPEEDE